MKASSICSRNSRNRLASMAAPAGTRRKLNMTNDRRRTVPIIERLRFKSAKDFLTALHGTHDLWQSETARWIFRGHGDARWKLSPSAFRDQAWKQFEATYRPARCNEAQRTMIERAVIWAFGE